MTSDEIREIAEIVGDDDTYRRFVNRINREFQMSDEDRNAHVYVLYVKDEDEKVGFSVIGHSPAKMRLWAKTFREEGWVSDDFEMDNDPFELMYMYVKPGYREKGLGEKLFKIVDGREWLRFKKGSLLPDEYTCQNIVRRYEELLWKTKRSVYGRR